MIEEEENLFAGQVPLESLPQPPAVQNAQEKEDQNLVVATKVSSRVKGFDIKQIYQQVTKHEPKKILTATHLPPVSEESLKKDISIKHKISANEKDKKKADSNLFANLTEEAMSRVQYLMDVYKFSVTNRFMIDLAQKTRSQFKQKLSLYLFYGIEELKLVPDKALSLEQKDFLKKDQISLVNYIKNLAVQIELNLIKTHNKLLKNKIERTYKDRANIILINIKDEANEELRRKILSQTMTAQMLATARQIDLYTSARREEMLARSRNIMAQNTLEYKKQDEEQDVIIETIKQQKQKKEVVETKEKRLDDKAAVEILELINKHIDGFYTKLKNDLPVDEAKLLCSHLDVTFVGRQSRT